MTWVDIAFAAGASAPFLLAVVALFDTPPKPEPRPPMMDLREAYRPGPMIASEARRYRGIQ